MMEVPTRNFLDPAICKYPHPTSHWQSEDGRKEILSHARILIPEKSQCRRIVTRCSDDFKSYTLQYKSRYIINEAPIWNDCLTWSSIYITFSWLFISVSVVTILTKQTFDADPQSKLIDTSQRDLETRVHNSTEYYSCNKRNKPQHTNDIEFMAHVLQVMNYFFPFFYKEKSTLSPLSHLRSTCTTRLFLGGQKSPHTYLSKFNSQQLISIYI